MELNVDEALRYLGIGGQAAESIRASVAAVADKLTAAIQPRYTYRMCSLQKTEAGFLLPEAGAGPSGRGRSENAGAVRSGRADGVHSGDAV